MTNDANGDQKLDISLTAKVPPEQEGARLDKYLSDTLDDYTRSRLKEIIKSGHVRRGDKVISSPNARVKEGDLYEVTLPPPSAPAPLPQDIPLSVVYEDDDLIVIDKAAGMVVHPATGHWDGTLVNALLFHCGDSLSGVGGVKRPGIVHRLDRFTSGLLVVAKNDAAHLGLSQQFADHGREGPLTRAYVAFVWGNLQPTDGTIHGNIGRSNKNALKMAVVPEGGKEAITHYETAETYGTAPSKNSAALLGGGKGGAVKRSGGTAIASKVICKLETGRTHQIRVHLTEAGHPLIADPVYGTGFKTKASMLSLELQEEIEAFNRQALHAAVLGFAHPITGDYLEFKSELPDDMQRIENLLMTL